MQYRPVRTNFWVDSKVSSKFTPEDKYFYLFLFTCPFGNLVGAFEFSLPIAAMYLGYDQETVKRLLKRFEEIHKVIYLDENTSEIIIFNYHKYNWNPSNKFLKGIETRALELKSEKIKKMLFDIIKTNYPKYEFSIPYAYPIGGVSDNTNTNTNTNTKKVVVSNYQKRNGIENENENNLNNFSFSTFKTIFEANKFTFDLEKFYNYYLAKDFMLGKDKMSDIEAVMKVWQSNEKLNPKNKNKKGWDEPAWLDEILNDIGGN